MVEYKIHIGVDTKVVGCAKRPDGQETCNTLYHEANIVKKRSNGETTEEVKTQRQQYPDSSSITDTAWKFGGRIYKQGKNAYFLGLVSRAVTSYLVRQRGYGKKEAKNIIRYARYGMTAINFATSIYTSTYSGTAMVGKIIAKSGFTGARVFISQYGQAVLGSYSSSVCSVLNGLERVVDKVPLNASEFVAVGAKVAFEAGVSVVFTKVGDKLADCTVKVVEYAVNRFTLFARKDNEVAELEEVKVAGVQVQL